MQAGGKQAEVSPLIEGWVGLRNPYVHPNMDLICSNSKMQTIRYWILRPVLLADEEVSSISS